MANFFDCVKDRNTPISDVVSQHRTATACHLGNLSIRLRRKLRWDPIAEQFVGDDEATGTWALEDTVILTDFGLTIQGAAFYEDRYVKRDGEWKILHTGYKRSFEELIPRASIAGIKLTAEWWATDGRSNLGA